MAKKTGATGAQTLARGISALQAVVAAPDGLSAQQVAEQLDVHRTVAHRMLVTLADAGLIAKAADAKYRGAAGLLRLQEGRYENLKHLARPLVEQLAEELRATATLLVAENDNAVALIAATPSDARFHLAFSEGDTHPLSLAAGGRALRALMPQYANDPLVEQVQAQGYAITHGEVEPGAWGIAVPVVAPGIPACINVISHREDIVTQAAPLTMAAAQQLELLLESEAGN